MTSVLKPALNETEKKMLTILFILQCTVYVSRLQMGSCAGGVGTTTVVDKVNLMEKAVRIPLLIYMEKISDSAGLKLKIADRDGEKRFICSLS